MRNTNTHSRLAMFRRIIPATLVLTVVFGLTYGQFSRAQDRDATRPESAHHPQQAILAPPIANFLPEGGGNIIIGRVDSNEDGIIDALDALIIYRQVEGESGSTFVPLDLGNAPISEVLDFQFRADGYGVMAIKLADHTTAVYLIYADGTTTQIQGLPLLNAPVVQLGSLYIADNSATHIPVILYMIDDETGDLLALHELQRSNTSVSFDPDGAFMLAFAPTSQALRIYDPSDIQGDPLSFDVMGNLAVMPQWSPVGSTFFYVEEDLDTRAESVVIIDASADDQQTLSMPDYGDAFDVIGAWSNTGRFITFFAVADDVSLTDAPIALIDNEDFSVIVLEARGNAFVPYEWSADDAYLLYISHKLDAPDSYFLGLYDAVNVTTLNIELEGRFPLAMAWHPSQARLAILTTNGDRFNVLTYDVASGALETITSLDNAPYTAVSLRWLGDSELGVALTFDGQVTDGVFNRTYGINTLTGESVDLIPQSVRLN